MKWKTLTRIVLSSCLFFMGPRAAHAQLYSVPSQTNPVLEPVLRSLILSHPRQDIREKLERWLVSKPDTVGLQITNEAIDMEARVISTPDRGWHPILAVNERFLLVPTHANPVDDRLYKQILLVREFARLARHIVDGIRLPLPLFTPQNASQLVRDMWIADLGATREAWEFAKTMNASHLLPQVQGYVNQFGEPEGIINAAYWFRTSRLRPELKSHWDINFSLEIQRVRSFGG